MHFTFCVTFSREIIYTIKHKTKMYFILEYNFGKKKKKKNKNENRSFVRSALDFYRYYDCR